MRRKLFLLLFTSLIGFFVFIHTHEVNATEPLSVSISNVSVGCNLYSAYGTPRAFTHYEITGSLSSVSYRYLIYDLTDTSSRTKQCYYEIPDGRMSEDFMANFGVYGFTCQNGNDFEFDGATARVYASIIDNGVNPPVSVTSNVETVTVPNCSPTVIPTSEATVAPTSQPTSTPVLTSTSDPTSTPIPTLTQVPSGASVQPSVTPIIVPSVTTVPGNTVRVTPVISTTVTPTVTSTVTPTLVPTSRAMVTPEINPEPLAGIKIDPTVFAKPMVADEEVTISGTARPFAKIILQIFSDPIIVSTIADGDGVWSYTLSDGLPAGRHEIYAQEIIDGNATIEHPIKIAGFTVSEKESVVTPDLANGETGSTTRMWVILLLVFGIASLCIFIFYLKNKRKKIEGSMDNPPDISTGSTPEDTKG